MEGINIWRLALSITTVFLLSGCLGSEKEIQIHNSTDENEKKTEEVFKNDNRLTNAVAVFHNKDVIAGISVRTFSRFHKTKIEKELKAELENLYPKFDITVSADSKIIMETKKLIELKDKKDIGKKIETIKSLSKEET
jgi:hypothetical protein